MDENKLNGIKALFESNQEQTQRDLAEEFGKTIKLILKQEKPNIFEMHTAYTYMEKYKEECRRIGKAI